MKEYITRIINTKQNGLHLCPLPTGYGKSYNISKKIAELISDPTGKRKIIYLTTMVKNLPKKDIANHLGPDQKGLDNKVLQIRSNFDEVYDKIPNIAIPEDFQTDNYKALNSLINTLKHAKDKKISDKVYLDDLKERINSAERRFRHEISNHLKKYFPTKKARLEAITELPNYKWIGILYPAVFTDTHQVLLMTVAKFLGKNSTLIEPSYDFLSSPMLDNAIIFIDEFDASKSVVLSHIIDTALNIQNEYISLFRRLQYKLDLNRFSSTLVKSINAIGKDGMKQFENLQQNGTALLSQYKLNLNYKTVESGIDRKQNFLFNDGSFHTVLANKKQYIRTTHNPNENHIDIFFESKKDFYDNRNTEQDIVIYSMLRDVHYFLSRFKIFLYQWAEAYRNIVNSRRDFTQDEMKLEDAISSILNELSLTQQQKDLLTQEKCSPRRNSEQKKILPEMDFYVSGMEIFELEDSDSHNESTDLLFVQIYDTPEKIISYLAEKATVFAVSATADIDTIMGNYNLSYLKSKLGELYHATDSELHERVYREMENTWQSYYEGKINIHTEIVKDNSAFTDIEQLCKSFLRDPELATMAATNITNCTVKEFAALRYCNLLKIMRSFWEHDDIKSLLCLEMALPKEKHPEMDISLLNALLSIAASDTDRSFNVDTLTVLSTDNFDEDKDKLLKELSEGKKRFVMSTYSTIGAGQNLQYPITDKSGLVELTPYRNDNDNRHFSKDFDALYLGDITHFTVNTNSPDKITKKDMFTMFVNVEELYHNGELNFSQKDDLIKLAIHSHIGAKDYTANPIYNTKSFRRGLTKLVEQAIGRICRTHLKSPDIYIYINEHLLSRLDVSQTKRHILPPEMKTIVQLSEQFGAVYSNNDEITLNLAERISTQGMWRIRRALSKDWNEQSMTSWNKLREVTLTHPTASLEDHLSNELINELYITSGTPQDRYLYSQYSDFSDVVIDFTNNTDEFRKSKRAKRMGESDDVAVWKMSEEESGLPAILKYPQMKEHFMQNGYAVTFSKEMYMMSPVLFHNIYKGALGEVSGKFILERERGITLDPITEPDKFEFFDFQMKPDIYVDFKNWKYTYRQDKDTIRKQISAKLDAIGGKRAYIINIVATNTHTYSKSQDQRIIEIPALIDSNGRIIPQALDCILKEDYE